MSGSGADAAELLAATGRGLQNAEWGAALFAVLGVLIAAGMKKPEVQTDGADQKASCNA